MAKDKCVLAYSGGMDSTISIVWIRENYDLDVVTLTVDIGGGPELEGVRERAASAGAVESLVWDVKDEFARDFIMPGLKAGAMYESAYALSTAFGRPLMAKKIVEAARQVGAVAVAHGCTGKGNDQVRFDAGIKTLAAHGDPLRVIAPAREWEMTRDEEKEFEPPEDAFSWTQPVSQTPDAPDEIEITFEQGVPVALNGEKMGLVALIEQLNLIAGSHGVGRVDHLENRLVGIKSREVYETPAAVVLYQALAALETATLSRDQQRLKAQLSPTYADLVYDGRWYTALRENLDAFVDSAMRYTTGDVRVRLFKGASTVTGRRSPYSLYDFELATYSTEDEFDHAAAVGFIDIYSLPARTQMRRQTMRDAR